MNISNWWPAIKTTDLTAIMSQQTFDSLNDEVPTDKHKDDIWRHKSSGKWILFWFDGGIHFRETCHCESDRLNFQLFQCCSHFL